MALTAGMKDKLLHREEIDLSNRKANEYHIRKYIQQYFEDMEELIWLLDAMPARQIKRLLGDGKAAAATMDLCEKILSKMELPTVQSMYPGDEIKAVRSFDLGAGNVRIAAKDGSEVQLQPIGCSVVCDLTPHDTAMIERTLQHVKTIRDSMLPIREKTTQREFYKGIYLEISEEAESNGVNCRLAWDIQEHPKSVDLLLRAVDHHEERRKAAAMLQPPHTT